MRTAYQLLLFDLDETLLRSDRTIHPRTLRVLGQLMDGGAMVGFATGRSPRCAEEYAKQLGPNAPIIHFNGAMIRRWSTGEVLVHHTLDQEAARSALTIGVELGFHVNLYVGDEILIERRTRTSEQSEIKDGVPHTVVGDLLSYLVEHPEAHPTKIMFIGDPAGFPRFADRFVAVVDESHPLVNSEPTYLEMLPIGVNKGSAVSEIVQLLGLDVAEVIAFGDNKNDAEMLCAAGLGVAMGNSHPTLRQLADVVIGDNNSDAIALFLEQLIAEGAL